MKRFSGSFVSRVLLCAAVTLLAAMPALAGTYLWATHISRAELVDGESNYDNAKFNHVDVHVDSDDTEPNQAYMDATGTLTLSGGSYTWPGGLVTGEAKSFTLAADMYVWDDALSYEPKDEGGNGFGFYDEADTGLNGVTATWTFPTLSAMNGSGTIPNFTSTEEQLRTAVPYLKLDYDESGNVKTINWAIVNPSDTSKPLALSYPTRIRIRAREKGRYYSGTYHSWSEANQERFDANVPLSGTIDTGSFDSSIIEHWAVQIYDRTDPNDIVSYRWNFYQSTLELELSKNTAPFETWQENPEGFFEGIESYGHIPDPIDLSHLEENAVNQGAFSLAAALPATYDLRKDGGLPAVRNQGQYSTCWAHAALGAMESSYMKKSLTSIGKEPNLSELHVAWFVFKDPQSGRSFPLHNKNASVLNQGGYEAQPVAFLTRMAGAAQENALPYSQAASVESLTKGKSPENYPIALRIRDIFQLGKLNDSNRDLAKRLMMEYGAIKMAYRHDGAGFNDSSRAYYYPAQECWGHAILLVGWDDNFSKNNFGVYKPKNNGAWLARNSWGSGWADGGYFWISYEQNIGEATLYNVTDNGVAGDTTFVHYGHDALGHTRNVNCPWSANVFQVQNDGESLREVGFYTTDNNTEYEISVYKFGTSKPSRTPINDTAAASVTGTSDIAGYHTVELKSPVALTKGEWFTVVVKMNAQFSYMTAVEELSYNSNVQVREGESFFSLDGTTWADGNFTSANMGSKAVTPRANACIKAFTGIQKEQVDPDEPEPVVPNKSGGGGGGCGLVFTGHWLTVLAVGMVFVFQSFCKKQRHSAARE